MACGGVLLAAIGRLATRRKPGKQKSALEEILTGGKFAPFTKMMEFYGAVISVVVVFGWIVLSGGDMNRSGLGGLLSVLACGAIGSWVFLQWGADQDKER